MTQIEELEDAALEIEGRWHGKRLELNMAKGLRDAAQKDLAEMQRCVLQRYQLRSANQGCYFLAAGEVDRELAGIA